MLFSGVVAFLVNLSIYWIIGNTSPVTYPQTRGGPARSEGGWVRQWAVLQVCQGPRSFGQVRRADWILRTFEEIKGLMYRVKGPFLGGSGLLRGI